MKQSAESGPSRSRSTHRTRRKSDALTFCQGARPYVLSALLLGLSYPSYPYVRLEVFAWIWMVPMRLALKPFRSFRKFFRNVYLTMLAVVVCTMSWLIMAYALGWRVALGSMPLVWTAWD